MKVLFSGGTSCDQTTMKRLALIADEIGFMDRPSVTFKDWGIVGKESPVRNFNFSNIPISFSAHSPPSGPVTELYSHYINADLANPKFVKLVLEGFSKDPIFAAKFISDHKEYGAKKGYQLREEIIANSELLSASLSEPVNFDLVVKTETHEGRRENLKLYIYDASIEVTNTLLISEQSGLVPIANTPYWCKLLALRISDSPYVRTTPRVAPFLGIALAKAVIPDEALSHLTLSDIFEYRKSAKDAYKAWSIEIDRLATQIAEFDIERVEKELPRIINTEVEPKLNEYRSEMKSIRDELFGDLIKNIIRWELPTFTLSYLLNLNLAGAIALFASALAQIAPSLVDYYVRRRTTARENSMAYLIGISPAHRDD